MLYIPNFDKQKCYGSETKRHQTPCRPRGYVCSQHFSYIIRKAETLMPSARLPRRWHFQALVVQTSELGQVMLQEQG